MSSASLAAATTRTTSSIARKRRHSTSRSAAGSTTTWRTTRTTISNGSCARMASGSPRTRTERPTDDSVLDGAEIRCRAAEIAGFHAGQCRVRLSYLGHQGANAIFELAELDRVPGYIGCALGHP